MSTIASRFQKLLPGLSAKERAVLIARQQSAGQEPDPELRRSMPPDQGRVFDRYMALACVGNVEFGAVCLMLAATAQMLTFVREHVRLLEAAAQQLEEMRGLPAPSRPLRNWRRRKTIEENEFLRGIAYDAREALQGEVTFRWQELQSLETIWAEIRDEFDGEDPVHPEVRARAEAVKEELLGLFDFLGVKPAKVGEPPASMLEELRGHVDEAFRRLGYVTDTRSL